MLPLLSFAKTFTSIPAFFSHQVPVSVNIQNKPVSLSGLSPKNKRATH
jgi:hypothetical protein